MRNLEFLCRSFQMIPQTPTNRMSHGDMGYKARTKKRFFPGKGTVDELVYNHKRSRRQIFLKGAHGTDGDQIPATGLF